MICVFLIMLLLLLVSFVFQIRDFYYLSRYKKPYDNTVRCRFRRIHTKERGFKVVECTNIFWNKKFEKLGKHCPSNCRGRRYMDAKDDFETMSSTDIYYIAKKIAYISGTIFSTILVILNIIEKL